MIEIAFIKIESNPLMFFFFEIYLLFSLLGLLILTNQLAFAADKGNYKKKKKKRYRYYFIHLIYISNEYFYIEKQIVMSILERIVSTYFRNCFYFFL